jgi:hypothetical protein
VEDPQTSEGYSAIVRPTIFLDTINFCDTNENFGTKMRTICVCSTCSLYRYVLDLHYSLQHGNSIL